MKTPKTHKEWLTDVQEAYRSACEGHQGGSYEIGDITDLYKISALVAAQRRGIDDADLVESMSDYVEKQIDRDRRLGADFSDYKYFFVISYIHSHTPAQIMEELECDDVMEYVNSNWDLFDDHTPAPVIYFESIEMVDVEVALEVLNPFAPEIPVKALNYLRENWDAAEPELLKELDRGIADPAGYEESALFFYALYLCAEMCSEAAFSRYLAICRLPKLPLAYLIGDILTENMHDMLSRTCRGRIDELKDIVEDQALDEFARWVAVDAMINLVRAGEFSRGEAEKYCIELLSHRLENRPTVVWDAAVDMAEQLKLKEAVTLIERAYNRGLVNPGMESLESVLSALQGPLADDKVVERRTPETCVSTEKEMKFIVRNWGQVPQDEEDYDETLLEPIKSARRKIRSSQHKVGRNDPCPCGSGKKFKKCCLGKDSLVESPRSPAVDAEPASPAQEWIEAGYYYVERDMEREAFHCWERAWSESLKILPQSILDPDSEECNRMISAAHFFSNWLQDFQYLGEDLSYQRMEYTLSAIWFHEEVFHRFPNMNDLLKRNFIETYSRLLFLSGKREEAFDLLGRMIAEYPDKAQGYAILAEAVGDSALRYNMQPDWPWAAQLLLEAKMTATDCEDWDVDARLEDVRNRK